MNFTPAWAEQWMVASAETIALVRMSGLGRQAALDAADPTYKGLVAAVYDMPVATRSDAERAGQTIRTMCLIKRGVL